MYHLISPDFRGETLLSLADLKTAYPDLWDRERMKYAGREGVLSYVVPGLDVTWGATVNLSAMHPSFLIEERQRLGMPFSNLLTRGVLEIPVERLEGHRAVNYTSSRHWLNTAPDDPTAPTMPPVEDFSPFEIAGYKECTIVPALHTEYLEEQASKGKPALGFAFIPHVLVASAVDISGLVPRRLGAS